MGLFFFCACSQQVVVVVVVAEAVVVMALAGSVVHQAVLLAVWLVAFSGRANPTKPLCVCR